MSGTISGINSNGSMRIHTRANQARTSANDTFQQQFKKGLGQGIGLTNSALRQVAQPIPGSAALSASLNDAARSLNGPSSLGGLSSGGGSGGISSTSALDGDMGSLQDEMLRNNQDMLEQQVRVSKITTEYSTRSYILKAMFDALKTIGSNIR